MTNSYVLDTICHVMDTSYFKDTRVLITGGAGFIGSNLVQTMVRTDAKIRVLDNLSTGKKENIVGCIKELEFIEGDIRDRNILKKSLQGVDIIFHLAALSSVPRSIADPFSTDQVNSQATLMLLIEARDCGVKRVVYGSSSSIYGDSPVLPKEESMSPEPKSPYALSKYAGERYCQLFYSLYGMETVALRYFNVFGPKQDPFSQYAAVIPKFIVNILEKKNLTIYGNGEQTRDFTYVDNVIKANLLAAETESAPGEVINIACGNRVTVLELSDFLMEAMGIKVERGFVDPQPGEVKHSQASIDKAMSLLGYKPCIDLWEGLRRTIEWFRTG